MSATLNPLARLERRIEAAVDRAVEADIDGRTEEEERWCRTIQRLETQEATLRASLGLAPVPSRISED